MKEILMQYRSEFKNSCIFVVNKNIVKVFDNDSILVEYVSNIESNKDIVSFKYKYKGITDIDSANKYLNEILKLCRKRKINYIVIDSDINYQVYDYYFTEYNSYIKYLSLGKMFNKIKRKYIIALNKVYDVPKNKYDF